jgi:phage terminase large subunit GpA-like protein
VSDHTELRQIFECLPAEAQASLRESAARGLDALRKPEALSGAKWAHRYFFLSAESSQREEQWVAWPYQIGWLDAMADDRIREVTIYKSARLGYTKCLLSDLARTAQHVRRNQCIWLPVDGDAKDFVKTDLNPMLEDVAIMRTVFPKALRKSKDNSLEQKKFLGSLCKIRGGQASGNYRRLTVATARADELDGFELSVEGAGTPDSLIRKRVEGATYPKCIWGSTGRKRGVSHIERLHQAMDVRMRFQITCPHCDVEHPIEWGGPKVPYGIKWDPLDPEGSVRHHCHHCHQPIAQADYLRLARTAAWVSDCGTFRLRHWWDEKGEPCSEWTTADGTPCLPPERVGLHAWTIYSEQAGLTWGQVVREFLEAHRALKAGNKAPMIQWTNETKGETWEETGETADVSDLQTRARASGYLMRQVPEGALELVASVDVQGDRFEIMVQGIGPGRVLQASDESQTEPLLETETWIIDYIVLDANPSLMGEWDRLWVTLQQQYQHRSGAWMQISGCAVDTGGSYTHQSYMFVNKYHQRNPRFRLFAIKGSSQDGDPIVPKSAKWLDINLNGRTVKRGVKLWSVGTDTAKDLIYGRLKLTEAGPGCMHFASNLPREFFKQYGNEKRIPVRVNGRSTFRWVHVSGANEVVDLSVYCEFVVQAMLIPRYSARRWQQLRERLVPDLFAVDEAPPAAAVDAGELPALPGAANPIQPGAEPATRPPPSQQKLQPAARSSASAQPAPSGLGSDAWRGRL